MQQNEIATKTNEETVRVSHHDGGITDDGDNTGDEG